MPGFEGDQRAPFGADQGRQLQALRRQADLKQVDAARLLDVTRDVLSNIERGRTRPNPEFLDKMRSLYAERGRARELPPIISASLPCGSSLPADSWSISRTKNVALPGFLALPGRVVCEVLAEHEPVDHIMPGRESLVVQLDELPRRGRIAVLQDPSGAVRIGIVTGEPGEKQIGYVVARLVDFGGERGIIMFDIGGLAL